MVSAVWFAGCTQTLQPGIMPSGSEVATQISASPTTVQGTSTPSSLTQKPPDTALLPTEKPQIATVTPSIMLSDSQKLILTSKLIQAAEVGDITAIKQFLKEGADINGRDTRGRTPVMAATHSNQVAVVKALVLAGADINLRDHQLDNPFLYAGAEGLMDILRLAIEAKADTKLTNRFGGTALIPAAERGHVDIVKELLTRTNVDVNHVKNLGWTALLEAILLSNGGERHQQIVQLLVDHGADTQIPDKNKITPLEHARARGFTKIEQILVEARKRDLNLISVASQGDIEAVKKILSGGVNIHAQDENGVTALIAAAYRNDLAIANLLIEAGADVNKKDQSQQSAYLISTSDGFLDLLKLTLRNGADVHSLDQFRGTGLVRAADRGHVEIIRELLKTDIKINHVNNLGWTALLEAIILGGGSSRHVEVVRLLVDAGADVNLADGKGVTPLVHTQQRGYQEMVQILLKAGAK